MKGLANMGRFGWFSHAWLNNAVVFWLIFWQQEAMKEIGDKTDVGSKPTDITQQGFEGPIPELEVIVSAASLSTFDTCFEATSSALIDKLTAIDVPAGTELRKLDTAIQTLAERATKGDGLSFTCLVFLITAGIRAINRTTSPNRKVANVLMQGSHSWPVLLESSDARNRDQIESLRELGFRVGAEAKENRILDTRDSVAVAFHHFISLVRAGILACSNERVKDAILGLPEYDGSEIRKQTWSNLAGRLAKSEDFLLVRRYFVNVEKEFSSGELRREWLRAFKDRFIIYANHMQVDRLQYIETLKECFRNQDVQESDKSP